MSESSTAGVALLGMTLMSKLLVVLVMGNKSLLESSQRHEERRSDVVLHDQSIRDVSFRQDTEPGPRFVGDLWVPDVETTW